VAVVVAVVGVSRSSLLRVLLLLLSSPRPASRSAAIDLFPYWMLRSIWEFFSGFSFLSFFFPFKVRSGVVRAQQLTARKRFGFQPNVECCTETSFPSNPDSRLSSNARVLGLTEKINRDARDTKYRHTAVRFCAFAFFFTHIQSRIEMAIGMRVKREARTDPGGFTRLAFLWSCVSVSVKSPRQASGVRLGVSLLCTQSRFGGREEGRAIKIGTDRPLWLPGLGLGAEGKVGVEEGRNWNSMLDRVGLTMTLTEVDR
jgi:hypothetical protein